jgi:hypothetical protein
MNRNQLGGITGTTIENMKFYHAKVGVFISGTDWAVRSCEFIPNTLSQTSGTTLRCISAYGSEGNSYIQNNTFTTTIDDTRVIAIYLITRNDGIAPAWESGFKGNFTIDGNSFTPKGNPGTLGYGAPRAYVDATSIFHQSGPATTAPQLAQFSLFVTNNDFSRNNTSSPVVCFARAGSSGIRPFDFFNNIVVKSNSFGSRENSTSQKGALYFTATSPLTTRSLGAVSGGVYSANNSIASMTLSVSNFSVMANNSLLFVADSTYFDQLTNLLPSVDVTQGFRWELIRATDFDTSAKCLIGSFVPVTSGTENGGKVYMLTTPSVQLGTTECTFKSLTFE